jgi:hypothetical protein
MARFAPGQSTGASASGSGSVGQAFSLDGPGSNGYLKRKKWLEAGSFAFSAISTGWHKIDAVGAGASGCYTKGGASGGRSIKEIYLEKGDEVLVTVGLGGDRTLGDSGNVSNPGGTTTISCAARGLLMTVTGGGVANGGTATGGDVNLSGAGASSSNQGGSAAPSANANGHQAQGRGGAGVGGSSYSMGGASSHHDSYRSDGAPGFMARGGKYMSSTYSADSNGERIEFWDLADVDGGGGSRVDSNGVAIAGGDGGHGAGGGTNSGTGGNGGSGGILGGGGFGLELGGDGGNGGGGGGTNYRSGRGGDGCVFLFWNEVSERAAP